VSVCCAAEIWLSMFQDVGVPTVEDICAKFVSIVT
jgi:hypothetical protein